MTRLAWAATFGTTCILAAVGLAVWAFCAWLTEAREDDAHYRRLAPEPVDREPWEPTAPLWPNSATPIYDALAAERLRAELDTPGALHRWMEATQ